MGGEPDGQYRKLNDVNVQDVGKEGEGRRRKLRRDERNEREVMEGGEKKGEGRKEAIEEQKEEGREEEGREGKDSNFFSFFLLQATATAITLDSEPISTLTGMHSIVVGS